MNASISFLSLIVILHLRPPGTFILSHFGPPTAPTKTASEFQLFQSVFPTKGIHTFPMMLHAINQGQS